MESSTSNAEQQLAKEQVPNAPVTNNGKQATPSASAPATVARPPPGFKFVKVKKPDGTIVTVKKPLTAEEIAAVAKKSATDAQFEVVTVKKPDGTLAKVRRPIRPSAESKIASTTTTTTKPATQPPPAIQTVDAKKSNVPVPVPANTTTTPQKAAAVQNAKSAAAPTPKTDAIEPAKTQTSDYQAALRAQKEYQKKQSRQKFKNALRAGLVKTVASAVGDGIMHMSDDDGSLGGSDDSDDDDRGSIGDKEKSNGHSTEHESQGRGYAATAATNGIKSLGAPGAAPQKPPPYPTTENEKAPGAGGQVTYKIEEKHIQDVDEKASQDRPLQRHWANISFYLLGSLSVVLPLLFLRKSLLTVLHVPRR